MKLEEYEKHIREGVFNYLVVVTPKFHELMQKYGIYCKECKMPFIPRKAYREGFENAPHYPTDEICGFCIYDMDSYVHSQYGLEDFEADDWS